MGASLSLIGRAACVAAWAAALLLPAATQATQVAQASAAPAHGRLASASDTPGASSHFRAASPLSLRAQHCVGQAAAFHRVNADILHTIILVESDGRPHVVNRNSNGTLDIGMAQINSIHLPELSRYGIHSSHLFDECVAAFVAAWHYARQVRRLGNTWQAIGAYHSRTPHHNQRYQHLVINRLVRLGVLSAPRLAVTASAAPSVAPAARPAKPAPAVAARPTTPTTPAASTPTSFAALYTK